MKLPLITIALFSVGGFVLILSAYGYISLTQYIQKIQNTPCDHCPLVVEATKSGIDYSWKMGTILIGIGTVWLLLNRNKNELKAHGYL
jgi:hypothetical protein